MKMMLTHKSVVCRFQLKVIPLECSRSNGRPVDIELIRHVVVSTCSPTNSSSIPIIASNHHFTRDYNSFWSIWCLCLFMACPSWSLKTPSASATSITASTISWFEFKSCVSLLFLVLRCIHMKATRRRERTVNKQEKDLHYTPNLMVNQRVSGNINKIWYVQISPYEIFCKFRGALQYLRIKSTKFHIT